MLSHNLSQAEEFYQGVVMVQQLVFLTASVNMHFEEKSDVMQSYKAERKLPPD